MEFSGTSLRTGDDCAAVEILDAANLTMTLYRKLYAQWHKKSTLQPVSGPCLDIGRL